MLRLYQSDKLEALAEILVAEYRPPASPFTLDTVIVQSLGMGRWVSLRLAERLGICAHTRFVLPAAFVWELLREAFGELPRRSPFSAEALAFRILVWLRQPEHLARAPRLAAYLKEGDELRRLQLAARIADVFDQYLVYREDWIAAWERGETLGLGGDEDWQALLWRDLASDQTALHRARLMAALLAKLAAGHLPPSRSPSHPPAEEENAAPPPRLAVFGVSTLPPVFLEVLRALAQHGEVAIYALNPCREYWGEIRDSREIGRLAGERAPEDLYLEVGHPLLASLGKQGREFFDALAECAGTRDFFAEQPARDSLLHILQADILELVDRRSAGRLPLPPGDRSLQIHVCHSPMREVEVLRDQLLARFDADPALTPGDVAVLTPDIDKYAPYIEAVFAEERGVPRLPFSIADRGLIHRHPLLETFLSVLDLPESRFCADATLAFLEQPAVQRRFGLCAADLPQIHDWVRATGARWGRDGAHKAEYGLPETSRHTWRDAVQRLMLGYALPQELAGGGLPLFGDSLPHDDIEGGRTRILGRFAEFLETLFEWAERLKGSQPIPSWVERLNGCIARLFDPPDEDQPVLAQLRSALDLLRDLAEQAGFREAVGVRLVKGWLAARLGQPSGTAGFLTGEITFCAMVPLRSLPFKLIAVLGLDCDSFPRYRHPPGFDLMARHPRRGDRSRRLDDRYLFLETLLSAREALYLSYVGRSIRDNGELPPSPLVSELIDVARQSVESPEGDLEARLVTEHPLQAFDPAYFRGDPRLPGFSAVWLAAARRLGRGERTSAALFEGRLAEPEDEWRRIDPDGLVHFFSHPVRYLLRRRLNLALEEAEPGFESREPFALDFRARDLVRHRVLDAIRQGREVRTARRWAEAGGLLPHGAYGEVLYGLEERRVESVAPELLEDGEASRLPPLPVAFDADGIALRGFLTDVSALGLAEYGFEAPHPRRILRLWLRHLLLCLAAPAGVEQRSVLRTPGHTLVFTAVAGVEAELARWLRAYWRGLSEPLPFYPRSSFEYAKHRLFPSKDRAGAPDEKRRAEALDKARGVWTGSDFKDGEGGDVYFQAAYRGGDPLDEAFESLALELLEPLLRAMTER